jgi:ABC-type multidrug transport system ATPase subunit
MLLARLVGLSKRVARRRTGELLERMSLTEAGDWVIAQYSGGMRRRADLAACLLVPRPVVPLAEPTTALALIAVFAPLALRRYRGIDNG